MGGVDKEVSYAGNDTSGSIPVWLHFSQCQLSMQSYQAEEREPLKERNARYIVVVPVKQEIAVADKPIAPSIKDIYPQVVASCFAHMLVIQAGINMAYSAILLPQLMASESQLRVSKDEGSWIASLMAIATPVGALVCGPGMDLLGRKLFSLITCIPLALSWFLIAFMPNHVEFLYVARIMAGFGGGLTTVSLVYISEIVSASWRPMLLCLSSVFVSIGILLTNILGVYLPWRVVALAAGLLTLLTAAAIGFYNPESPYWLLMFRKGSEDRARRAMRSLNPNHEIFSKEWERLVASTQEKHQEYLEKETSGKHGLTAADFLKRSSLMPLVLLMTIFLFQQLSGTYPIIFYAVQVFESIGGHFAAGLNSDSATILLGVIRFMSSLLTVGLSRTFGRRHLMITSAVGMAVSSFSAAVYFQNTGVFRSVFNVNNNVPFVLNNASSLSWTAEDPSPMPDSNNSRSINLTPTVNPAALTESDPGIIGLVCILVFVSMSSIGVLIIPWTLIGEILPLQIRGVGGGFICAFAYILMSLMIKVFPFMLDVFNISGLFYFYSFISVLIGLFVHFFLPETLGKSFKEIEKYFVKSDFKT